MRKIKMIKTNGLKIALVGEGGQGIQTAAEILAVAAIKAGLNASYLPHFGVEQRGGASLAFVILNRKEISYPRFSFANLLAITAPRALPKARPFVDESTFIINLISFKERPINMLLLGVIAKHLKMIGRDYFKASIKEVLNSKAGMENNLKTFDDGLTLSEKFYNKELPKVYNKFRKPKISHDDKKTYIQFPDQCKSCGLCLAICPQKALSYTSDDNGIYGGPLPKVDMSRCIGCDLCEQICPEGAIKVEKKSS